MRPGVDVRGVGEDRGGREGEVLRDEPKRRRGWGVFVRRYSLRFGGAAVAGGCASLFLEDWRGRRGWGVSVRRYSLRTRGAAVAGAGLKRVVILVQAWAVNIGDITRLGLEARTSARGYYKRPVLHLQGHAT